MVLAAFLLIATACARIATPQGWAGPRQADDTLFVSVKRGKMAALNPADFSIKWIFPPNTAEGKKLKLEAIYGTPVVADGTAYFGGYDGNVYALDVASGEMVWSKPFETGGPVIGGLVLGSGTLFVGSDDGKLYALDPKTGGEKLKPFDVGDSIWATPLLADSLLYVPSVNGKLYALDPNTLEPMWPEPFEADAGLLTDPVLADKDTLLVGGIDRTLYALNPTTGEVKWSFEADNWFWSRPLVANGKVYVPNLDSHVYALDLATGRPLWDKPFEADSPVRSSPLLVGDVLIVVDRTGNVYGLNPATGVLMWGPTILDKTVLADPILLGGQAIIVAQGGNLYSIDPANEGASSPVEVRQP